MKILQGVLVVALSLAGLTNGEDDGDLRQEQINYRIANHNADLHLNGPDSRPAR